VPKVLEARSGSASDLVDIGQVFQRSGTLSISWRAEAITSPADFRDRKVGVWDFGNEFEVTAGARKVGLEAGTDYESVIQAADMSLLLTGKVDVAEAMIYNEYAQVLEATNTETGNPFLPTDLNVINWNDEGTAMLQDALFARASWLARPGHEDLAIRFLRASFQGWIYCRTNPADCVGYAVEAGATLGAGHQAWMLNEVNALVWPSPGGIGIMDPAKWQRTVDVLLDAAIIDAAPPADAIGPTSPPALEGITDDTAPPTSRRAVEVTPGGEWSGRMCPGRPLPSFIRPATIPGSRIRRGRQSFGPQRSRFRPRLHARTPR
jgi:NitT/TauT family transport system substrate-binding protein